MNDKLKKDAVFVIFYQNVKTIHRFGRFCPQLINGQAKLIFRIIKMSPKDKRLYVSLNVTEAGTGENDTIVDTSVFLAKSYYDIDFSAADQYFKPGFPYTLKVCWTVIEFTPLIED